MADALITMIDINVQPALSDTVLTNIQATLGQRINFTIADGTTASLNRFAYAARRSVTNSGTPDVLNLSDSSLISKGGIFIPAKLVLILVYSRDAAYKLTVGAGTNPINMGFGTNTKVIGKSPGVYLDMDIVDGWTVTASSADRITIATNSASAHTYDILLIGR